jgi:hypothetical protein
MTSSRHEWVSRESATAPAHLPYENAMPPGHMRLQTEGDLHLITFNCHDRLPYVTPQNPNKPPRTCSKPSAPATTSPSSATSSCPSTPTPYNGTKDRNRSPQGPTARHIPALGRRPRATRRKSPFRSAEGRSGAAGGTTKLPSSMPPPLQPPPTRTPSPRDPKTCQAPKPPKRHIPNQIELA